MRTAAACLSMCLAISVLSASNDSQSDLVEHAKGSARIVVATVTDIQSAFAENEFGDQTISSQLSVRVDETMKGRHERAIVVTVEGGTVGDLTMEVSDMPLMERGKRAVLFLNSSPRGGHVPYRRGAGVLELNADNRVTGTDVTLDEIREAVKASER